MKEVKNLQLNCFHIEDDFRLRFLIDWVKLKFVVIVVLYRYSNLIYTCLPLAVYESGKIYSSMIIKLHHKEI